MHNTENGITFNVLKQTNKVMRTTIINDITIHYFNESDKIVNELVSVQFEKIENNNLEFTEPIFYYIPIGNFGILGQFLANTSNKKIRMTRPDFPKKDVSSYNGHYFDSEL